MKKIALLISAVCLMAACSIGPEEVIATEQDPATDAVTRGASSITLESNIETPYGYWEITDITFIGSNGQTRVLNSSTPGMIWQGYTTTRMYYNTTFQWGIDLQSVKVRFMTRADVLNISPNCFVYAEDVDTYENSMVALDLRGMQGQIIEVDIPTTDSWWNPNELRHLNIFIKIE
ncbi:MAG: hypothetical protein LIO85_04960 [Rikenellaceae bacterium]|nr:hypothetical protein [Rikenellaceae bacterium]